MNFLIICIVTALFSPVVYSQDLYISNEKNFDYVLEIKDNFWDKDLPKIRVYLSNNKTNSSSVTFGSNTGYDPENEFVSPGHALTRTISCVDDKINLNLKFVSVLDKPSPVDLTLNIGTSGTIFVPKFSKFSYSLDYMIVTKKTWEEVKKIRKQ